jgi:hypothetical protein
MGFGAAGSGIAFYQAEVPPLAPDLYSMLSAEWLDSAATPAGFYAAAWSEQGKLPAGPVKTMDLRKAAVVHERYATPVLAAESPEFPITAVGVGAYGGPKFFGVFASLFPAELPLERTEYYYSDSKDVQWWKVMSMIDAEFTNFVSFDGGFVSYRSKQSYSTQWGQAPFSPLSPPDAVSTLGGAFRRGDEILVGWPMYGDRGGHTAYIPREGRTALYANGELVGENEYSDGGFFSVAPEPAEYRLELSYSQSTFELTTHQEVVWSFESAHVDEGDLELLPLLTLQFNPRLNELGEAPRGRFQLPVSVVHYGQKQAPAVRDPSVEVSYDDGASWTSVRVERRGQTWNLLLDHPQSGDYVSLRASTQDNAGNAVQQTLVRAYALAGCHDRQQ